MLLAIGKDIRRHARSVIGARARLGWDYAGGNVCAISGTCKDVSEGGIRLLV